ncbi:hypothetical protein pb186bvf_021178 [Paramecium bursaria]
MLIELFQNKDFLQYIKYFCQQITDLLNLFKIPSTRYRRHSKKSFIPYLLSQLVRVYIKRLKYCVCLYEWIDCVFILINDINIYLNQKSILQKKDMSQLNQVIAYLIKQLTKTKFRFRE